MTYHVYDERRTVYETFDEARAAAQAAIDECRRNSTVYDWSGEVSEITVYEAPADCEKPWRDGVLVLEARERVVEDKDHPLGKFSEFDLVDVRPWKVNVDESFVGALSPTGGPGGTPELEGAIPLADFVEVWSTQTPSLNGTTMAVSMTPEPDSFELVVADLLPDDDDSTEEPGEMCRRALAKASTSVDLIRKVRLLVVGAEDEADFEATYGTDPDEISVYTNAAREIIALVRAADRRARS